jgi:hypothetical protein
MCNEEIFQDCGFTFVVAKGANLARPGIYEWRIKGVGTYIGKYKRVKRLRRAYATNVSRLLAGKPLRFARPVQIRIHEALAEAVQSRRQVTLTIIENPHNSKMNSRERELINERGTLNGPSPVYPPIRFHRHIWHREGRADQSTDF